MGLRLYVGNIPFSTTEQDLQDLFGTAGQVASVNVVRDMATGRARGFAFVEMATEADAQAAITQEGVRLDALYLVLRGLAEVTVASGGGRRLATLGPGELIGEVSLLEDRPASATVKAVEPTLLLAIPHQVLAAKLVAEPSFAARWYRAFALILAQRLRQRVTALTQQLERDEAPEDPYADLWQPLEEALEDLKTRLNAADKEARQNGRISAATTAQIGQRFASCATGMNDILGERSGLDEHVRDELGGRVKLDLLPFLLLTSSAERVYCKPRGYAGDYSSIEVIYQNLGQGSGRLGPLIDRCFLDLPAAKAVRNRRRLLVDEIQQTCAADQAAVRITSLACGPAEAVGRLREWLRTGPPHAEVTGVACEPLPYQSFPGFHMD